MGTALNSGSEKRGGSLLINPVNVSLVVSYKTRVLDLRVFLYS